MYYNSYHASMHDGSLISSC